MKKYALAVDTAAAFSMLAACHHIKDPVAARPSAPAPIAAEPARVAPAAQAQPAAAVVAAAPAPETPRPTAMTREERTTLNDRLAHLEDALFDYDRFTIRRDATTALKDDVDVIRGILTNYPEQKLVIEGNADERGSAEYNLGLGDKRAVATKEFLTNMGLPENQLTVISYGKEHPVCSESTEACWQKNRRAHITASR